MRETPQKPGAVAGTGGAGFPNPLSYVRRLLDDRFQRRQQELRSYLEMATPIALRLERLYQEWREVISEPIQDGQKAANQSAAFWWRTTDDLRRFRLVTPPKSARKYHRLFADALWNASTGSEIAKNGFRSNKFSEVSRGLGYLDRYVELMPEAERELGRLLRKYRLVED